MRTALSVLAVVAVVGGCSAPADRGTPAPPTTSPPAALPTDEYRPSAADRYEMARAEVDLTNACLAEFGVAERLPAPDLALMEEAEWVDASRLYGITDSRAAEQWGYRIPAAKPLAEPSFDADENLVLMGVSDPAKQEVDPTKSSATRDGVAIPPGGCVGSARQELYGSAEAITHFTLGTDLAVEAWESSRSSAAVVEATGAWSDCMADRGFEYEDPLKISFPDEEPTQAERDTAVADVDCKGSSRLVEIWRAENIRVEEDVVSQNMDRLTAERAEIDTVLERAGQVS